MNDEVKKIKPEIIEIETETETKDDFPKEKKNHKIYAIFSIIGIFILLIIAVASVNFVSNNTLTQNAIQTSIPSSETIENIPMEGVFRYANWGDDVETIAKLENKKYTYKDENNLLYKDIKLMRFATDVYYGFKDGKFNAGTYTIKETHTNQNLYIDDFYEINNALIEKYGQPTNNKENWRRNIFEDDPGLALYYGDVEYLTVWITDECAIMHGLRADNFEIKHSIAYLDQNNQNEIDTSGL